MHRQLLALREVQPLGSRPNCIPKVRLQGTRAKGLTYEKKVGKVLKQIFPAVKSGKWFEYMDQTGHGYCQPDHYVVLDRQVLLIECKLTETPIGYLQMRELYQPILEKHYGMPVTRVLAARRIITRRNLIFDIRDATARPGAEFLWHLLA